MSIGQKKKVGRFIILRPTLLFLVAWGKTTAVSAWR